MWETWRDVDAPRFELGAWIAAEAAFHVGESVAWQI
jgi:hypothetical protein